MTREKQSQGSASAGEPGQGTEVALSPPRSKSSRRKRKAGLIHLAVSDIGRLGRISAVLIRHGFGNVVDRLGVPGLRKSQRRREVDEASSDPAGTARRLRAVFEELGATYVKLGQVLSTRPDLLPPEFIRELSLLQDQSSPMPFAVVKEQVEEALGQPLDVVFRSFSEKELATGSIAQTHLAVLPDGRELVVKVQRPGLHELIRSDIDLLYLFARLLEATIEEAHLYSPLEVVSEFERALQSELDFTVEAAHIRVFRQHVARRPLVHIPEVIEDYTSRTVLVMERIFGDKITVVPTGSPEGEKLALELLDLAYSMLFEYGIFHGDPHPGNLLYTRDGKIGLIDFGLIGRLTQQQQDVLMSLIIAIAAGDVDGIARGVMQIGRPMGRISLRELRDDIVRIRNHYLRHALQEVDVAAFFMELLEAGRRYGIRVPPDYAIIAKATISLEGIVRHLHPQLDIPATLAPYSRRLLLQRYGPQRLSQAMLTAVMSSTSIMRELPAQFSQVLMDMEYDGVRVRVENTGLADLRRSLNVLGTKIALGLCSAALLAAWVLSSALPQSTWRSSAAGIVGVILLLVVLLWHFWSRGSNKIKLSPIVGLVRRSRRER